MVVDALDVCEFARPFIERQVNKYRSKYSKRTYNQHQYVALNVLRFWWDCTYRKLRDRVLLMPAVRSVLDLEESVPH